MHKKKYISIISYYYKDFLISYYTIILESPLSYSTTSTKFLVEGRRGKKRTQKKAQKKRREDKG